jgi:hypothetical protein
MPHLKAEAAAEATAGPAAMSRDHGLKSATRSGCTTGPAQPLQAAPTPAPAVPVQASCTVPHPVLVLRGCQAVQALGSPDHQWMHTMHLQAAATAQRALSQHLQCRPPSAWPLAKGPAGSCGTGLPAAGLLTPEGPSGWCWAQCRLPAPVMVLLHTPAALYQVQE